MDSTGVALMLHTHRRLASAGRRLVVVCPSGPVLRVLRLTGVEPHVDIRETREATREVLGGAP